MNPQIAKRVRPKYPFTIGGLVLDFIYCLIVIGGTFFFVLDLVCEAISRFIVKKHD